jgi:hypothetical protein
MNSARAGTIDLLCPVCKIKPSHKNRCSSIISPWIREFGINKKISNYSICAHCEIGYFSYRYSNFEMEKIYKSYRGKKYVDIRQKWEPWYTSTYNSNHETEMYVSKRKEVLRSFIEKYSRDRILRVVDIGGDQGQYIPDFPGAQKYVQEVSDKSTIPGILKINNILEVADIDLIIYSHVLEHVVDPVQEIEFMMNSTKNLYIEVPAGIPEINKVRKSKSKFIKKLLASFSQTFWIRTSSPSAGRKINQNRILTQSEHINFFTESSFEVIASKLNLNLVVETRTIYTPDFSEGYVIQALLNKKET